MTQFELAVKSGVSLTAIMGFERGCCKNPRIHTLEKIAQALGVDVSALISPSEEVVHGNA